MDLIQKDVSTNEVNGRNLTVNGDDDVMVNIDVGGGYFILNLLVMQTLNNLRGVNSLLHIKTV
jgi:hypothetical protein